MEIGAIIHCFLVVVVNWSFPFGSFSANTRSLLASVEALLAYLLGEGVF